MVYKNESTTEGKAKLSDKMFTFFSSSYFFVSDTRETGFVNAIVAAGVTFQVTRACTTGDILDCPCDKTLKKRSKKYPKKVINENNVVPEGEWEWGGCGDNINYGFKKSKDFLDTRYKRRSDMKTLVKLHNYAAGRLVSILCIYLTPNFLPAYHLNPFLLI